jgi:predicted RNA polymerase sigma factor
VWGGDVVGAIEDLEAEVDSLLARKVADAALISSAPTMHAALVTAEDALFAQAVHFSNPDRERVQAALEAVRAALSAAKPASTEGDS